MPEVIADFNERVKKHDKHSTLFRTVMKLHTARSMVMDPALCLGGPMEYVRSLYRDAGVMI